MDQIKKIIQNKRIFALLSIIALILIYLVVIAPFFDEWQSTKKNIQIKRGKYLHQTELIKNIDKYKKEFDPYQEMILFEKGETAEKAKAFFLKEVEGLVQAAGLRIVDVKVLPVEEKDGIHRFLIQIEAEALMDQLTKLLHQLGTIKELIQIENLSIERKEATSETLFIRTVFAKMKV